MQSRGTGSNGQAESQGRGEPDREMGWGWNRQVGCLSHGRGWGGSGNPSGRQGPVPVILGASRHRAGPDLASSPW